MVPRSPAACICVNSERVLSAPDFVHSPLGIIFRNIWININEVSIVGQPDGRIRLESCPRKNNIQFCAKNERCVSCTLHFTVNGNDRARKIYMRPLSPLPVLTGWHIIGHGREKYRHRDVLERGLPGGTEGQIRQ